MLSTPNHQFTTSLTSGQAVQFTIGTPQKEVCTDDRCAQTSPTSTDAANSQAAHRETSRTTALENEIGRLSESLMGKFEQLSLIHQLSEQLELRESSSEVCHDLLENLLLCMDSEALAIDLKSDEETQSPKSIHVVGPWQDSELAAEHVRFADEDSDWIRVIANACQLATENSEQSQAADSGIAICNAMQFDGCEPIRCVVVQIKRGDCLLGRMIGLRRSDREEFGTVEADLLKSTAMMMAVHLINQRQYQQMQLMFEGTIQSLVSALDAKDAYTCGHSGRVADLSVALARELEYDEEDIARIRMAGVLHDIGKIGVKDEVLCKPGKLTDEEFEQIKQHPVLGYEILKGIRPFHPILPAVRHHHESWDGRGYPDGLRGDEIPRDAQLMAVADAFDAMTSDRPYRSGMPLDKVIRIFRDGRGKQWASDVVDVLLRDLKQMASYVNCESGAQVD